MEIRFVGTGAGVGATHRSSPCIHVEIDSATRILLECGPDAPLALRRCGLDPDRVDWILASRPTLSLTAGVPFLTLRRGANARPLTLAGPDAWRARLQGLEALFGEPVLPPGGSVHFLELAPGDQRGMGEAGLRVEAGSSAGDARPAGPPLLYRIQAGDRGLVYLGRTRWSGHIVELSRGADLLICALDRLSSDAEGMGFEELEAHRRELEVEQVIISPVGPALASQTEYIGLPCAVDNEQVVL